MRIKKKRKLRRKETLGTPVGGFGKPITAFSGTVHYLPQTYKEGHMSKAKQILNLNGSIQPGLPMRYFGELPLEDKMSKARKILEDIWGLGKLPPNVLIKSQTSDNWFFVGQVDGRLAYVKKDGSTPTEKELKDAAHAGPGIIGLKTRSYKSLEEAEEVAKELGLEIEVHRGKEGSKSEAEAGKKYYMNKTYQVVTPESAEQGDYDDQGFEYENNEFDTLWDMAEEIRSAGATELSSGGGGHAADPHDWYLTVDGEKDYRTGSETTYSFHPNDLTSEEASELQKLVKMDNKNFNQAQDKYYPDGA